MNDGLYIVNMDTGEKLSILFSPMEINWDAKSTLVAIPTMGRNNPFYHYTGAEDKIEFELDWYAMDRARVSAINSCNKLKSWSRNSGYNKRIPRIKLIFGTLFSNHVFLIEDAPYTMSLFQKTHGMMPAQCMQSISLVKITSYNETHEELSEYRDPADFEHFYDLVKPPVPPKSTTWL